MPSALSVFNTMRRWPPLATARGLPAMPFAGERDDRLNRCDLDAQLKE
jgi:hypothetical protein